MIAGAGLPLRGGLALASLAALASCAPEAARPCERVEREIVVSASEEGRADTRFFCGGALVLELPRLSFVSYSPDGASALFAERSADDDARHVLYAVDDRGLPIERVARIGDRFAGRFAWTADGTGLYASRPPAFAGERACGVFSYFHILKPNESASDLARTYGLDEPPPLDGASAGTPIDLSEGLCAASRSASP